MVRDFEKMGIYDLRNYARMIGVKSPTTLKRNELIEKINQIIEGNAPKQPSTKKGRPPMHKPNDEFMLDMILPDNLFKTINNSDNSNEKKQIAISDLKYVLNEDFSGYKTDNILFQGYFDEFSNDYGIIYVKGYFSDYAKENIIILRNMIEKFKICSGDFVVGSAKYIPSKNLMLATEIKNINSLAAENIKRDAFENIHPNYPTQKIPLSIMNGYVNFHVIDKLCPIAKGARVAVNFQDGAEKPKFAEKLINAFKKNGIYCSVVSIGDRPEEIGELMRKCENSTFVEQVPSQGRDQFFSKVQMIMQNSCRRVECGEDVAVIFYNAQNFIHAYSQNCILSGGLNEIQANIVAENKFFDNFNLARSSGHGSLTIVALGSTQYVDLQSNCTINLNQAGYQNTDVTLDVRTSHTKNIEKIVPENELLKLNYFHKTLKHGNEEECIQTLFDN